MNLTTTRSSSSFFFLRVTFLVLLIAPVLEATTPWSHHHDNNNSNNNSNSNNNNKIAISAYRDTYDDDNRQDNPNDKTNSNDHSWWYDDDDDDNDDNDFEFKRFQSPLAIQEMLRRHVRKRHALKPFRGKDGRHGMVSSTKLGGDWVLAESSQTAMDCTTEDVLTAYLSGPLQKRWNPTQVLDCTITRCDNNNNNNNNEPYYQQDLVLHSQRVIRSHTGIMKYSQRICIDKIGGQQQQSGTTTSATTSSSSNSSGCYCVSIRLDPSAQTTTTTARKPFEKLSVYVGLQQNGPNVDIYAAGIMKVNRKVVPNLLIFDASGIAGSMAGKGTLWLAAHFAEKKAAVAEKILSALPSSSSSSLSSLWTQYHS